MVFVWVDRYNIIAWRDIRRTCPVDHPFCQTRCRRHRGWRWRSWGSSWRAYHWRGRDRGRDRRFERRTQLHADREDHGPSCRSPWSRTTTSDHACTVRSISPRLKQFKKFLMCSRSCKPSFSNSYFDVLGSWWFNADQKSIDYRIIYLESKNYTLGRNQLSMVVCPPVWVGPWCFHTINWSLLHNKYFPIMLVEKACFIQSQRHTLPFFVVAHPLPTTLKQFLTMTLILMSFNPCRSGRKPAPLLLQLYFSIN